MATRAGFVTISIILGVRRETVRRDAVGVPTTGVTRRPTIVTSEEVLLPLRQRVKRGGKLKRGRVGRVDIWIVGVTPKIAPPGGTIVVPVFRRVVYPGNTVGGGPLPIGPSRL